MMTIRQVAENEIRFGAASAKKEIDEITRNINKLNDLVTKFSETDTVNERESLVDEIGELTIEIVKGSNRVYEEVDKSNDNVIRLTRAANNCRCIKD